MFFICIFAPSSLRKEETATQPQIAKCFFYRKILWQNPMYVA